VTRSVDAATHKWTLRDRLVRDDLRHVGRLVDDPAAFSREEQELAVSLVAESLGQGPAAGYAYLFAGEDASQPDAYTCFGRIPATVDSFDLYWIAVSPRGRRNGLGTWLLRETERCVVAMGGARLYVDTSGRPGYAGPRTFYASAGYAEVARLADFYAPLDDKVVYCKTLVAR
jgi:GNAT superfamily N-acetyltransferase